MEDRTGAELIAGYAACLRDGGDAHEYADMLCDSARVESVQDVLSAAHAAERRAAVLAALLGCAGEVASDAEWALERHHAGSSTETWPTPAPPDADLALRLLATDPHELMRLVPATRPVIEHALGAAGLTLEDLDVLEETT